MITRSFLPPYHSCHTVRTGFMTALCYKSEPFQDSSSSEQCLCSWLHIPRVLHTIPTPISAVEMETKGSPSGPHLGGCDRLGVKKGWRDFQVDRLTLAFPGD